MVQSVQHIHKFEKITKKYGRRFRFRILHVEALAIIEGTSAEISVPQVLKEFGIPTSKEMIANSGRAASPEMARQGKSNVIKTEHAMRRRP